MSWTEENVVSNTWTEVAEGAFQHNAFQTDAFQVKPTDPWVEGSVVSNTWSEEGSM